MTHKNCDCGAPAVDCFDGEWLCRDHLEELEWGEDDDYDYEEGENELGHCSCSSHELQVLPPE